MPANDRLKAQRMALYNSLILEEEVRSLLGGLTVDAYLKTLPAFPTPSKSQECMEHQHQQQALPL